MTDVEYMIARTSWLEDMDGLSESERGRLFTALLEYAASGEKKEPRGTERVLFHKLSKDVDDLARIYIYNSKDLISQEGINNSINLVANVLRQGSNTYRNGMNSSNLKSYIEESFERFFSAYPEHHRVNRKKCLDLWWKIKPDEELLKKMLDSIEAWKQSKQWQTGYVPNPDKWLSQEKWNDATPPPYVKPGHYSGERTIKAEDMSGMIVDLDKWSKEE